MNEFRNGERIIICPFDQKLIGTLRKTAIVVETDDPNLIRYISREVNRENKLHTIRLTLHVPLSELSFEEDWIGIPLLIVADEFGDFQTLIHQMNILRQLNVKIFLSSKNHFNFTGLQILSSLKIACGLLMDKDYADWEESLDIMHYGIYSPAHIAPIEPFAYIASQYGSGDFVDFNTVYFNNPEKFLHLNETGQVALNALDLANGTFIADNLESLELASNEAYKSHIDRKYEVMLSLNDCAFCPAFRICQGTFSMSKNKEEGCKKLFSEMMDAADFVQSSQHKDARIWQW